MSWLQFRFGMMTLCCKLRPYVRYIHYFFR